MAFVWALEIVLVAQSHGLALPKDLVLVVRHLADIRPLVAQAALGLPDEQFHALGLALAHVPTHVVGHLPHIGPLSVG
eukprot:6004107-Alexandrium_andersonii.AAC.1